MLVSIIVSTYNQPKMLNIVLAALENLNNKKFEVVIADDGSNSETKELIDKLKCNLTYNLKHVWQEDDGFRAAAARNKAVADSVGEYLIFLDGDCVVLPSYLDEHIRLRELGWFVRGNRAMLSEKFTQKVLDENIPIHTFTKLTWFKHRLRNNLKRLLPLYHFPLGIYRKFKSKDWYGVKTCNLGVWRKDFELVNGFDERYTGWGREDADLAVRLFNNGIKRKEGIYSTCVLHLWHPESSRERLDANDSLLHQHIVNKTKFTNYGYVKKITEQ